MSDILTLLEYKTLKGITNTNKDGQINAILPMISDWIKKFCGRNFEVAEYTEKKKGLIDYDGKYVFYVKHTPIVSVDSIELKYYGTTATVDIDTTKLDIFEEGGYIYYGYNIYNTNEVILREEYKNNFYYTITYTGGDTVPSPVKLACSYIISDTLKYLDENVVASGSISKGAFKSFKLNEYWEEYESANDLFKTFYDKKSGLIVSPTVLSLLQPYKQLGQSM